MSTPPNARTVARSAAAMLSRDARSSAAGHAPFPATTAPRRRAPRASACLAVLIGDDDVRAALRQQQRDLPADAAATADDERDLAAELALRRHPLELRLFERPVLDAERLGSRQRDVIVKARELASPAPAASRLRHDVGRAAVAFERLRAGHHVNRVDEELRRDPRFTFVLPKPNTPSAGITTTDGFESRSAGESASRARVVVGRRTPRDSWRSARRSDARSAATSSPSGSQGTNIGQIRVRRK